MTKTTEILKYWQKKLSEGDCLNSFSVSSSGQKTDRKQTTTIDITDLRKGMDEVARGKTELEEIFYTAGVLLTLYKLRGYKKIGILVNGSKFLLPVIMEMDAGQTVREFLNRVIGQFKEIHSYSHMNYFDIIKYMGTKPDIAQNQMLMLTVKEGNSSTKKSEEHIRILNGEITYTYPSHMHSEKNGMRCMTYIKNILTQMLQNTDEVIDTLSVFPAEEWKQFRNHWQGRMVDVKVKNLAELFLYQMKQNPESTALIYQGNHITYKQLSSSVQSIVSVLIQQGIKEQDRVGILCTSTPKTIAAVMAVVQLGAIYVPFDIKCPAAKLEYMIEDCGIKKLILTGEKQMKQDAVMKKYENICIKADFDSTFTGQFPVAQNITGGLYIIYTSGSTGKPKGVLIRNDQFANLIHWYQSQFEINRDSRVMLLTNFAFDASVKNIIAPLIFGSALVLASDELFDTHEIVKSIKRDQVTHINCVPALAQSLIDTAKAEGYSQMKSLKHLILGGERFLTGYLKDWISSDSCQCKISNVYGPTEGTDLSTCHILTKEELLGDKEIPIGRPIDNRFVYVRNEQRFPCLPGEKGELYISGTGVIDCYLNPDTAPDVFFPDPGNAQSSMYKTGDLAEWTEDGELIYRGRCDNQIKFNGQRLELEELERILNDHDKVKQCVAALKQEDDKPTQLIMYYQLKADKICEKDDLKEYCGTWFPASVMPNQFVSVESFQLSANGKVDRSSLPTIPIPENTEKKETSSDLEQKLITAWKNTLSAEHFSSDTRFFEAGGSSLLLYKLKDEIEKEVKVQISILDFFEYATIEEQALFLASKGA